LISPDPDFDYTTYPTTVFYRESKTSASEPVDGSIVTDRTVEDYQTDGVSGVSDQYTERNSERLR
jgi:hypothetical protein